MSQLKAILLKNFRLILQSKCKIFGELVLPLIVAAILYFYYDFQNGSSQYILIVLLMGFMLKIYLGFLGVSICRGAAQLFLYERVQNFRQYQRILGLKTKTYFIGNLLFLFLLSAAELSPAIIVLIIKDFNIHHILSFLNFLVTMITLGLMLSSIFKDIKMCQQCIGIILSMSIFLSLFYDPSKNLLSFNLIIALIPSSSFALSILNSDSTFSMISLAFVPIYILIFLYMDEELQIKNLLRIFRGQVHQNLTEIQLVRSNTMNQDVEYNVLDDQWVIKGNLLTKTYDAVLALYQVSFELRKGQILGLLGKNGAGKTTLVDILTSVITPTSGSFQFSQNNSIIGICYQKQIHYPRLTLKEHLQFYCAIKEKEVANIADIISTLKIQQQQKKYAQQLSGGNKRKLSVAIALIGKPKILIFDQPTSGLDPHSRRVIWDILSQLRKMNYSIILTSHHMDEIQHLANRVHIIQKGRVIREGTVQSIKQQSGKGYYLSVFGEQAIRNDFKTNLQCHFDFIQQVQNSKHQSKFFLKQVQESALCKVLKQTDKLQQAYVTLSANNLQQSFIALLKNYKEQEELQQGFIYHRSIASPTFIKKISGLVLRVFYLNISEPIKNFIFAYNINIFYLLLLIGFRYIVQLAVQKNINSQEQVNWQKNQQALQQANNSLTLYQGFVFLSTVYFAFPVNEKQAKIVNLLRVRGVSLKQYWIGTFIGDYLFFLINFCLLGLLHLIGIKFHFPIMLILGTGIGIILFAYVCTLFFEKVKTGALVFFIINMILGFLIVPSIVLAQVTNFSYLKIIRFVYPLYDLSIEMAKINPQIAKFLPQQDNSLIYSIIILLAFLIVWQGKIFHRMRKFGKREIVPNDIELHNVSHSYGSIEALKNISFNLNNQKIALLGENGAGKSTLFSILSSQLYPNQGSVYLSKKQLRDYDKVLQNTGICLQENSLWNTFYVKHIIKIISLIVGVPTIQIQSLLERLDFEYQNYAKQFTQLSGGNKRKVCATIALLGTPQVSLLDQCSTGLDAWSRNLLIEEIKNQQSGLTIFTTHWMPEAEQTCSKMILLKNGVLKQFGLIHEIVQQNYGSYWINAQKGINFSQERLNYVLEELKAFVKSSSQRELKLQIDRSTKKLSQAFETMMHFKSEKIFDCFELSQPRLQDAFLKLVERQQL